MKTVRRSGLAVALLVGASPVAAQSSDSARAPTGAFIGHVVSSVDSVPARSVEIRLFYVDSARTIKTSDADSLDVFLDSLRTRMGVTDSSGAFAIRRLAPGHYLFRLRRIGYQPMEGALTVGNDTVRVRFVMDVASQLLAKVQIVETATDRVKQQLDRVGFVTRSHYGTSGTLIDRGEVLRRHRDTLGELLTTYGIYRGTVVVDRMEMDYEDVKDYPADLVIGIEIYRHNRPTAFNATQSHSMNVFATGGISQPLILVWTFIPGR